MLNRQTKNRGRTRTARTARRSSAGRLITAGVIAGLTSVPALAGPQGERVTHGRAKFQRQGNHTKITTSHRAIINYNSFNLSANESVRFVQPGANSRVLNRIQSSAPTHINGSIAANGQVYFVNPSGIRFGRDAVLNVGTLYAAAGNISDADFLNNVNRFTDLSGDVVNRGTINAQRAAHLVGQRVANFGEVVAPDGMITLSAGDDVLIGQRGGRVFARIEGSPGATGGVENHGVIDAGSGRVIAGVGDHFALAIYGGSEIKGSSVRLVGGANSSVRVGGTVDASNASGRGGSIDVLGGKVAIDGATLDASGATGGGAIHVGGGYQGQGDRLRSEATLVTEGSTLRVDATTTGDAGRAIVWSDGATMFYGDLSGKGARKGGFAEVSGKRYLDFNGSFDLTGPIANGSLLLDPTNIFIVDGPERRGCERDER
jgi:filamentous hemagglutinin family protein